jgi:hypothetical protein
MLSAHEATCSQHEPPTVFDLRPARRRRGCSNRPPLGRRDGRFLHSQRSASKDGVSTARASASSARLAWLASKHFHVGPTVRLRSAPSRTTPRRSGVHRVTGVAGPSAANVVQVQHLLVQSPAGQDYSAPSPAILGQRSDRDLPLLARQVRGAPHRAAARRDAMGGADAAPERADPRNQVPPPRPPCPSRLGDRRAVAGVPPRKGR